MTWSHVSFLPCSTLSHLSLIPSSALSHVRRVELSRGSVGSSGACLGDSLGKEVTRRKGRKLACDHVEKRKEADIWKRRNGRELTCDNVEKEGS